MTTTSKSAGDKPKLKAETLGGGSLKPPQRARPPFDQIALLLQGGGALGAYQAGVYEALRRRGCIQIGWRASPSAPSTQR